jgi:hypothetical protein
VAVQRGPLVYCAESVDLPAGHDVEVIRVDPSAPPEDGTDGTVVTAGQISAYGEQGDEPWPYRPLHATAATPSADRTEIVLVPYHSWANRGPSTMRVWLPAVKPDRATPPDTTPTARWPYAATSAQGREAYGMAGVPVSAVRACRSSARVVISAGVPGHPRCSQSVATAMSARATNAAGTNTMRTCSAPGNRCTHGSAGYRTRRRLAER